MYCEYDSSVLEVDVHDPWFERKGIANPVADESLQSVKDLVEAEARACPCGGKFRFSSILLCPACRKRLDGPDWWYGKNYYILSGTYKCGPAWRAKDLRGKANRPRRWRFPPFPGYGRRPKSVAQVVLPTSEPATVECPKCSARLETTRVYARSTGELFAYCDQDATVLRVSAHEECLKAIGYRALMSRRGPDIRRAVARILQKELPACPCGGRFRLANWLRCPRCSERLSGGFYRAEHYFEIEQRVMALWWPDGIVDHRAYRRSGPTTAWNLEAIYGMVSGRRAPGWKRSSE
ncbi:MAG TPA: hypothetical protein VI893_04625 [Thermoplasmata archaeon]|nr:hypothetical protein [Thermoplasmata archaeon]